MQTAINFRFIYFVLAASIAFAPMVNAERGYELVIKQEELTTTRGLERIHARVLQTAKQYCPTYLQIRSHRDVATCVDGVVEDLVTKVGDKRLSSYVGIKDHQRQPTTLAVY